MAEVAVATALGLVQIITPLLSKLSLPMTDVERDIESMRSWLHWLQAFTADNYGSNDTQLHLVAKVRQIAYDIEDVVDEYMLHSSPYTFHHYQITRKIHSHAHNLRHGFPLRRVSHKITSIRKAIDLLKSQIEASNSGPSSSSTNRVSLSLSPLLLDDEMVGYENLKQEYMRRLVDGERRVVTLAIDGPPGSGKTTFAKNVFWKPQIQAHFDCHAWICVSHNPDMKNIPESLLKQLCSSRREQLPADDGSTFRSRLRRYLSGKRYLVVLDDICKEEDWIHLKEALPDSRGSRIIVTTRYSNLSSISATSSQDHVYSLPGLASPDAWKLFCRRAFPDGECPSELKDVSLRIMKRCEGLPLAIVAVAGALARKSQALYEWEEYHSDLGSVVRSSSSSGLSSINNALLRSYMDLSSSLKCCFLYMSIFPEDHSVERGRLIRLWVAERFATATDEQTAEEVAEDYLNELVQRNLLHVCKWDIDGRRPRNCRVLNLVLKFIIDKCKDENFAAILGQDSHTNQNQSRKIRRLSVHDRCHLENADFATVRSMFLLRVVDPTNFEQNLHKFKLIKVLDVQGAPVTKFPKEMSRFTLVTYLSFRDTNIKCIPEAIQKLSYLETLDLKQTHVTELPQEISSLHNLRHLFVYKDNVSDDVAFDSVQGVNLQEGISKLTNLQNLSLVNAGPKGGILTDLIALTQLRKLGVTALRREHGKHLWAAVEVMKSLKTLDVTSVAKEEYIQVVEMQHPPKNLQRLYLKGRLEKIPAWIAQLDYLMRIGLKWSKLRESPLGTLKRLPNLTELELVDCFTGEDLTFEAQGFKKLKILVIEDFINVNTIKIEIGAMAELKQMSLRRCLAVTMVLGLENLSKLEQLTLYDMAEELVAGFSINGEDRDWVKHIPLIRAYTLTNSIWSLRNLSDPVSFSHC